MLPEDVEYLVRDGNTRVKNGWLNKVQRSTELRAAVGTGGTFPPPEATTEPWGGSKIIVFKATAGVANGADMNVDTSIDWRNRFVEVLSAGAYDAATKLPGEAGWVSSEGMQFTTNWDSLDEMTNRQTYSGAGSDDSGATGEKILFKDGLTVKGRLFACKTAGANLGNLQFHNASGGTLYVWLVVRATDQFPTRT